MERKRLDAIDLCKWLFSFMIVYIHMQPVLANHLLADRILTQGVFRVAVPFFFAASAFFLFRKMGDPKTCGRENWKKLGKFCLHIFSMYVLWLLIYRCYYAYYDYVNGQAQRQLKDFLWGMFFAGELQHLWYLMATVYAAPIVYLLWKGGRRTLLIGCLICEVLCCLHYPYEILPIAVSPAFEAQAREFTLIVNALLHGVPMMGVGVLCVEDHKKRSARHWFAGTLICLLLFAAEIGGLIAYYGLSYAANGMLTRIPLIYCLLNRLLTVDFRLPKAWMAKALRLSSTWVYLAHMMVLFLFRWIFAYRGVKEYVIVCGLTVLSGVPYVAFKLWRDERKKKKQTANAA